MGGRQLEEGAATFRPGDLARRAAVANGLPASQAGSASQLRDYGPSNIPFPRRRACVYVHAYSSLTHFLSYPFISDGVAPRAVLARNRGEHD